MFISYCNFRHPGFGDMSDPGLETIKIGT